MSEFIWIKLKYFFCSVTIAQQHIVMLIWKQSPNVNPSQATVAQQPQPTYRPLSPHTASFVYTVAPLGPKHKEITLALLWASCS